MRKLLVVDDEADAREFVRAFMEAEGWEVHEAEDGAEALKKVDQLRPELVILDVQMPRMDGFAVFGALIKDPNNSGTKVIMLTGVAEKMGIGFSSGEMGEFLGQEPDAYVEKPVEPTVLARTVRRVMGDE